MNRDLLAKYDVPVPRYTSYPTAPQWSDTPQPDEWRASLAASVAPADASVSVYVHVPFCESLCTFCGCNTVITRDHAREEPYVDLVLRELDTYLAAAPTLSDRPVRHVHLGGGTPTFLAPASLDRLAGEIHRRLPSRGEHFEGSIEADPRVTSADHLAALAQHGFQRLSLGVQDFDDEVQALVNRRQSYELVERLTAQARATGFVSVNFDLIYGLPGQTPASARHLADLVADLRPDRLAVYSFARVPWIKPAQRKFRDDQVPAGAEKRALYEILRDRLMAEGYVELGLDHFALPHDSLAVAAESGSLHRNFMGYAERPTTTLLGLGVSAISETADCYHQNEKILPVYERRVQAGEVPTLRGHKLSADDQRRRDRIRRLMTTFRTPIDENEEADAREFLAPLVADGLVAIDHGELRILPGGRAFLRNAASFFDRYYRSTQPAGPMYSTL